MHTAQFQCIKCQHAHPLTDIVYNCSLCGGLLEVVHPQTTFTAHTPEAWKQRFESRQGGTPGPDGSGVWRYREWVLPEATDDDIVTLGEGASALTRAHILSDRYGIDLLVKQCGHTLTGSFKDLGMTVLVSQVNRMRRLGHDIRTVICASTGDTSAALAAFGAAAKIPTVVLLPKGKISAAQLVQPLSHGARVIAIDTDFDGCMAHVQRLANEPGIYLANSKNSLRIEGQKTVAFEICQGLGWEIPDWVAIPGGNLGNVSALVRGFENLRDAGIIDRLPRVICAQAAQADPLFRSYQKNFASLEKITAQPTQASAIRIGDPVSFPRAITALKKANGTVSSITEQQLTDMAIEADATGLYLCPHTAVAMAAVLQHRKADIITAGERVVVVSTAHGLKFTEFKQATASNTVPGATHVHRHTLVDVSDVYDRVREAVLTTI